MNQQNSYQSTVLSIFNIKVNMVFLIVFFTSSNALTSVPIPYTFLNLDLDLCANEQEQRVSKTYPNR
jgi:hypothetical protein